MSFLGTIAVGAMAQAYNEDKAAKEAQVAEIQAMKRKWLFTTGMEKISNRRERRKEAQARVSNAVRLGFDRRAALVLETSGELDSVLTRINKLKEDTEKDVSSTGIRKMSQAIIENVPEDKIAQATQYALDLGAAEDMDAGKLIDVIFSATDDASLNKAIETVGGIPSGVPSPEMSPTGVNLIGLTELTPSKTKQVKSLIESRIAGIMGATALGEDTYQWTDPTSANIIIDKALDYYMDQRANPYLDVDLADITSQISNDVRTLVQSGVQLKDIADNFNFGMNPNEFEKTPLPKDPLTPPSATFDENSISIIDKNNLAAGG